WTSLRRQTRNSSDCSDDPSSAQYLVLLWVAPDTPRVGWAGSSKSCPSPAAYAPNKPAARPCRQVPRRYFSRTAGDEPGGTKAVLDQSTGPSAEANSRQGARV